MPHPLCDHLCSFVENPSVVLPPSHPGPPARLGALEPSCLGVPVSRSPRQQKNHAHLRTLPALRTQPLQHPQPTTNTQKQKNEHLANPHAHLAPPPTRSKNIWPPLDTSANPKAHNHLQQSQNGHLSKQLGHLSTPLTTHLFAYPPLLTQASLVTLPPLPLQSLLPPNHPPETRPT
jgi:hypothetical protein